ncbi:MAG: hypothetical protein MUF18_07150 [Fimbriiglobus sp.]|jgi:hypothetical protein|nr:hypothetical protein [Fimbriiglobus sp.]
MNELIQAAGYAALVYLLFNFAISFGSGRPLTDAINPNRRFLPMAAVGLFGSAYSLLVQGAFHTGQSQADLLRALVSQEKAVPQAVGAVSLLVFGLSLLILWVWCMWRLPRDPRTFCQNPKDLLAEYRKALGHYVRWEGGLDFAMLCEVRDGTHILLAEGADDRDIARGVGRLPMYGSGVIQLDPTKMATEQKDRWRLESRKLFDQLPELDDLVMPVRQGKNVGLCFDVRYGAMYVEVLDRPDDTGSVWLYLFAASLNQHEVGNQTAAKHFAGLVQAVRHIRGGLSKG